MIVEGPFLGEFALRVDGWLRKFCWPEQSQHRIWQHRWCKLMPPTSEACSTPSRCWRSGECFAFCVFCGESTSSSFILECLGDNTLQRLPPEPQSINPKSLEKPAVNRNLEKSTVHTLVGDCRNREKDLARWRCTRCNWGICAGHELRALSAQMGHSYWSPPQWKMDKPW